MRICEAIYGRAAGRAVEELVEAASGRPCPCKRGMPCLLTDDAGCNPLALVVPDPIGAPAADALSA